MKIPVLFFLLLLQAAQVVAQNKAVFSVQADKPGAAVSPTMWGIFFEDINLGADGGLYAELIKNRSFEFFKPLMGWQIKSSKAMGNINFGSQLLILNRPDKAETNPRFLRVTLNKTPKDSLGLTNEGFRGMGIKKGLRYDFSVLYRLPSGNAKVHLELVSEKGEILGSGIFVPKETADVWQKGETSFVSNATDPKAKLNIWFEGTGVLDLDMLSLFPAIPGRAAKEECGQIWYKSWPT